MRKLRRTLAIGIALTGFLVTAGISGAQPVGQSGGDSLSALVEEALNRNPRIPAAQAATAAAEERISQAGAWEDPVLSFGFMNLPTTTFDFADDFMTMKIVQLGQRVPLPGQIRHRREGARWTAESSRYRAEQTRIDVVAEVKRAYAELYYRDRAIEITDRNLSLLSGLRQVTRARYVTGVGRQPAVLRVGLEIDGLTAQRIALQESREAALARLNALVDRPPEARLDTAPYPRSLSAFATPKAARGTFIPALELGRNGRKIDDLPPVDTLIARATRNKPALQAHVARIRAQEASVGLARARRWPAPQLSIAYAQRDDRPDMMNASLSFSLPIFASAKQNAAVREEEQMLADERARHSEMVNEIEREVAAAYAGVIDVVGQLAVFGGGILARAEANLDASLVAYRAGAEDFLSLLDSQTTVYRYQLEYHRRLADLLVAWAALEQAVGEEIRP